MVSACKVGELGRLFKRIASDERLRGNTLILVCSDNGPEKGAGRADGLKCYKTHLFEVGIRSPLVAWGPGLIDQDAAGRAGHQAMEFNAKKTPAKTIYL